MNYKEEDYLFRLTNAVLDYVGVTLEPDEVADLVMLRLINISK